MKPSHTQQQFEMFQGSASPEAIAKMAQERITLRANIEAILRNTADDIRPCLKCDATIFLIKHKNGKKAPYTIDGTNHFANCPKAEALKKP